MILKLDPVFISLSFSDNNKIKRIKLLSPDELKNIAIRSESENQVLRGEAVDWLKSCLTPVRDPRALTLIDIRGIKEFALKVYKGLLKIPFGTTVSYGNLATLIGHPGASRAVGTALANNPLPLLFPCHRIVKSNGELGNFTPHPSLKEKIINFELNYPSIPTPV